MIKSSVRNRNNVVLFQKRSPSSEGVRRKSRSKTRRQGTSSSAAVRFSPAAQSEAARSEACAYLAQAADVLRAGEASDLHAAWLIEECMSLLRGSAKPAVADSGLIDEQLFSRIARC